MRFLILLLLTSCSLLPVEEKDHSPLLPADLVTIGYSDQKYREVEALLNSGAITQYPPFDELRILGSDGKTRIYRPQVVMDKLIQSLGEPVLIR